jgi:hypothetical protein
MARAGKSFNIYLNDDERAKLEAHRVRLGLRSHAEAVRELIEAPEQMVQTVFTSPDGLWRIDARIGVWSRYTPPDSGRPQTLARSIADTLTPLVVETNRAGLSLGPIKPKPGARLKGGK